MFSLMHGITDPYLNHAVEEVVAKRYGDCFILWENTAAVLLGKHQNARREINFTHAEAEGIAVVRRITGGGAVYTDSGNLNFTFISKSDKAISLGASFSKFTAPVLEALRKMGIPAEFSGRNDLTVEGKKFSGNAQCRLGSYVIHHGTLLYDSDLEAMSKVLTPDFSKFRGKGVKSVASRVANLKPYIKDKYINNIKNFRDYLHHNIKSSLGAQEISLTTADRLEAERLANEKYRSKKWIMGSERPFNIRKEKKFLQGTVAAEVFVEHGIIKHISFSGDYFSLAEHAELEALFVGIPYERTAILAVLDKVEAEKHFLGVSREELISLII